MSSPILSAGPEVVEARRYLEILVPMMGLDVLMGLLLAFITKQLNSSINWLGLTKKIGVLLMIATAGLLDPLVPGNLMISTTCAYIVYEGMSITENAALLGLPVPKVIKDALAKVREVSTINTKPAKRAIKEQADQ